MAADNAAARHALCKPFSIRHDVRKVFWSNTEFCHFAVVQHRKIHKVGFLFKIVQTVEKLWDSGSAPYRIVLRDSNKTVVARAQSKGEIMATYELLRDAEREALAQINRRLVPRSDYFRAVRQLVARLRGGEDVRVQQQGQGDEEDEAEDALDALAALEAQQAAAEPVTLDHIWESFFRQSRVVGMWAMEQGYLTKDDCEFNEPFLYLGLPALTVLESLERSKGKDGIDLATGQRVTRENCPPQHLELLESLEKAKAALEQADFSRQELNVLRQTVLYANDEVKQAPRLEDEERSVVLMRVASGLQSIAIRTSQMSFYLRQFNDVIDSLYEPDDDD